MENTSSLITQLFADVIYELVVNRTGNDMGRSADEFISKRVQAMAYYSLIEIDGTMEISDVIGAKNFIDDVEANERISCMDKLRLTYEVAHKFNNVVQAVNLSIADLPVHEHEDLPTPLFNGNEIANASGEKEVATTPNTPIEATISDTLSTPQLFIIPSPQSLKRKRISLHTAHVCADYCFHRSSDRSIHTAVGPRRDTDELEAIRLSKKEGKSQTDLMDMFHLSSAQLDMILSADTSRELRRGK